MKKLIVCLIILLSVFNIFFYKKTYLDKEKIYNSFISNIKDEKFFEAYNYLYPLILTLDTESFRLMHEIYTSGKYGVEADLIKAKIWKEREMCLCFDTGETEYNEYLFFSKKQNYEQAAIFLQKSAEQGNKDAINLLKNEKYLKENKLIVDPRWIKYWRDFDYENLYPYCQEIEACRKDVEAVKNKRLNH